MQQQRQPPRRSVCRRTARAVAAAGIALAAAAPALAITVTSIAWDRHPSGNTAITLTCDGPPPPDSFRAYTVPDPPRIVIVLTGVDSAPEARALRINNGVVEGIRLGVHPDRRPSEVHAVLDLASEGIVLQSLDADGNRVVALVGPGAVDAGRSASPTSTPTVRAPTPTPTPTPSPTPTRVRPTPTRAAPSPPVEPLRRPSPVIPHDSAAASPPRAVGTPPAEAPLAAATAVVEITASHRGDGSTLLLVSANGRLPQGCARVLEVSAEPPRLVVSLSGLAAPDLPRTIHLDDPNLERVRLVHDAQTVDGELHMVVHLDRPGITVLDRRQVGPNLVLRLGGPGPTPPTP